MKRAILVGTGTALGLAAVFSYTPQNNTGTTEPAVTEPAVTEPAVTEPDVIEPAVTERPAESTTIKGATENTAFGPVQVAITTTKDGTITNVNTIQFPNGDSRSARISNQAIPTLEREALTAQSADIAAVSGASYTSEGFIASLSSAIAQAPTSPQNTGNSGTHQ